MVLGDILCLSYLTCPEWGLAALCLKDRLLVELARAAPKEEGGFGTERGRSLSQALGRLPSVCCPCVSQTTNPQITGLLGQRKL